MSKEDKALREAIRRILEQAGSMSEINDEYRIHNWAHFEEFGVRLLDAVKYKGDYGIIYTVKQEVEQSEGWHFDG